MAALDRRAAEEFGVPTVTLMEAAGRQVAEAAARMTEGASPRVVIVAGKGNNGGDGLVAARALMAAGGRVTVLLLARDADVTGDAGVNLHIARRAGVEISNLDSTAVPGLRGTLANADLVIDAIFGTGFHGPIVGLAAKAIDAINASGRPVLAVDIPSGVNGDTGAVEGPAVRATTTVTLGLPKTGLALHPGADFAGRVWVADVGHPKRLIDSAGIRTTLVTQAMVDGAVPLRRPDTHKGTYGRVLVVAGAIGYSGAAVLSTLGALRAGAGLVTVGVPFAIYPIVASAVIEGMPVPLADEEGALAAAAAEQIRDLAAAADVVACGPGLSRLPGPHAVVRRLLAECTRPLVLDADALNCLAGSTADLLNAKQKNGSRILFMGGHVIRSGTQKYLIDLMERGFVSAIAMNGAGLIHDFEIALAGSTSEDVDAVLGHGRFGMADETGRQLNAAISEGAGQQQGMGQAVCAHLAAMHPHFGRLSILVAAARLSVPVTVHVGLGTDIIHMHPAASGEAIGATSLRDFRRFTSFVAGLEGGVYLNCGSAVMLPEVFLKAVSLVRNRGIALDGLTTVNFDFVRMYRPETNVVRRPVAGIGRGYSITGHHELLLPLLAAAVKA